MCGVEFIVPRMNSILFPTGWDQEVSQFEFAHSPMWVTECWSIQHIQNRVSQCLFFDPLQLCLRCTEVCIECMDIQFNPFNIFVQFWWNSGLALSYLYCFSWVVLDGITIPLNFKNSVESRRCLCKILLWNCL